MLMEEDKRIEETSSEGSEEEGDVDADQKNG